jgi:hypothetical protein
MASKGLSEEDIKKEIETFTKRYKSGGVKSEDFQEFENEMLPFHFTFYEKACNYCAKILNVKADKKKQELLEESLKTCHLNTTPEGVTAFSILMPLAFILAGIVVSLIVSLFAGSEGLLFFIFAFVIFGVIMIMPLSNIPNIMANNWRLRASNQMVLSVFYIVSYMRHTSNLELAIKFTSDHIAPPLSVDFKKIIWNVESSKFDSVKDSLNHYLEGWKKYNMEYVESMHLVVSSLYETTEKKRVSALEKSLSLILESTYETMLHYSQNLKSPITMLHMLGVILPILGLVILPLVVSFMEGVKWYHLAVFYNVFLIAAVWYLGKAILSTRPTGYGQADITEINPELKKYTNTQIKIADKTYEVDPKWIAIAIITVFTFISLTPILFYEASNLTGSYFDIVITNHNDIEVATNIKDASGAKFSLLGYKHTSTGEVVGPYGLGSTLISIAFPLGLILGLAFYYKSKTKRLVHIRERTKQLENEFASAIFQLGNRIGDGIPAEIAFPKVAQVMQNTASGTFFQLVSNNIAALGMGVEDAIFHKKYGAINKYPSALIESSMKVFVESSKKGPDVAAEALINISTYIKEMHRVDERLKDLMAEITSSMSSQINFLAPLIAGIVIGLTSMITTILNVLGNQVGTLATEAGGAVAQGGMLELFGDSIPTFYFQLVVGLYIVQITYLLTVMLNTIQNGYDPLNEKSLLGQNFMKSGALYCVVSTLVILFFNIIAATVISLNLIG